MALPTKHILRQRRVVATLARTALRAATQRFTGAATITEPPPTPGPEILETIPPLPGDLVRDYVRHVGGDPGAYRRHVPAHLFPQWGFPLAVQTLRDIPYPMTRVLNGGCRLEINGELPAGEPLRAAARLQSIDDDGRRAVLHQRIATGTDAEPELVVGHLFAIVPLGHAGDGERGKTNGAAPDGPPKNKKKKKKERPRVPAGAREVAYWRVPADAGLAFAMLTGDFNPIHWIPPYARAAGFKGTILHGFATMARAIEGLNRGLFAGATDRIRVFDCKFTRPLLLPAKVGLYTDGDDVYVGDAPGGPAYLVGHMETAS